MTPPTLATRPKPEGKIEFRLQRRPHYLRVAIRGEVSFEVTTSKAAGELIVTTTNQKESKGENHE